MSLRSTALSDVTVLSKRLDIMICLLLESGPEPAKTVTEKIERLIAMSLTDSEIAGIVGKKANYVGATRSRLRKKK